MSRTLYMVVGVVILFGLLLLVVWPLKDIDELSEPEPVIEPVVVIPEPEPFETSSTVGYSVEGRELKMYTYGTGDTEILFVGGIHGGYEWNSTLLAYDMMDYLSENPDVVPSQLKISILPTANPDGLHAAIGAEGRFVATDVPADTGPVGTGRFNANNVDLNRNFACKWQKESTWRGNIVSAGTAAFSEPEAAALRDYVTKHNPVAVVFWHSKAGAVYASECHEGVLPETLTLMNVYASAGGYRAVPSFDAYPITGDAEGWLASIGIPAVTVEFTTHESTDWSKNLAGTKAVIEHYAQ